MAIGVKQDENIFMPLIEFWEKSKESVLEMSVQQIVAMAGDGSLKDKSQTSEELRHFLTLIESSVLRKLANQCLTSPFPDSGFVLQDIINEAGRRLGMTVQNGIYRGKKDQNNCDGLWRYNDWTFIVEVKTTDAYSIQLSKIAKYLSSEVGDDNNSNASCLIVVGRQDTATLEDQLRGSKHNWNMRIVGVEALFSAIELQEITGDKSLEAKIVDLFIPQEFTRVDKIISTAFDFATDQEEAAFTLDGVEQDLNPTEQSATKREIKSNPEQIEEFKQVIADRMSNELGASFLRRRSFFESGQKRFSVAVSKLYENRNFYWYAYHPRQRNFLEEVDEGYFVLGCLGIDKAFAIPVKTMNEFSIDMATTSPKGDDAKKYCHVFIKNEKDRYFIWVSTTQTEFNISEYEI